VGKSGVLEHKSGNIFAYRNSPTLFRTVASPIPYGLPFPKIGVRNPNSKLQSLLSQERVKLRTANFGWYIHRIHPNNGRIQGLPNFLSTPIISGTGKIYEFHILYSHSQDRSEQKPIKNFGKSRAYSGTLANFQGTHI